ncbi:hypothetical protein GCM10027062_24890 [Nocardioides hungaricus]
MTAATEEVPPGHRDGYELETGELTVAATTYDDALTELQERVPEGWRILHIRVGRG